MGLPQCRIIGGKRNHPPNAHRHYKRYICLIFACLITLPQRSIYVFR